MQLKNWLLKRKCEKIICFIAAFHLNSERPINNERLRLRHPSLFIIIVFLFSISAFAQREQSAQERQSVFDVDLEQTQKSNEQFIPQQQLLEQAFEKAIDPEKYTLGPGDQLLIKVAGVIENQFIASVSPEGYLTPAVSEVYVSGETLANASEMIKAALAKTFLNATFTVKLVKLRKFRVYVVGQVRNPGTYYLRAIDRLSDAIQLAGGIIDWGDDTRIEIKHNDDSKSLVNMSEFYLTGSLEYNNFLEGGDVIYVPQIDLKKNYVIIEGNVGSQGIYQTRENETLFGFLTRLQAINRRSNIENIVLVRSGEQYSYNLLDNTSDIRTKTLQTGDRIIIPSTRDRVYVRGEVIQPGPFAYLANYTTKDYAGLAGILETAKGLNDLYVIRAETGDVEYGRDVIVNNGDIVVVPRRARETFKDYLTILTPIISIVISAYAITQASK